ncbi:MAG: glycosyltransferase family 2 protein, partial [Lachnospiraceae bacterium]|nr:glycosyltransferase family 2 protein [Lachnospiraceae bacterium]
MISIVVPVYNVEKYLERCVDSLINQTYENIEILLIDDGSKDNSGQMCDEYANKDSRITVYHKENGGLSDARNYGMDRAKGEYIIFIDSDDYVEPNMMEFLI